MEQEFNFQAIVDYVSSNWELGEVHGIEHWKRVERNGLLLATEGVNTTVVRLFAYLHDHKRLSDGYDWEHGPRAAENLLVLRDTLLSALTDEEFDMLARACREHTVTQLTGVPTIDACFDADRMDLPRVGYTPDPERMASPLGAAFARYNVVNDDCTLAMDVVERLRAEFQ